MSLDFPHAGEVYSLVAALVWAFAVILLRKSGDTVAPAALNLFKNTFAFLLLIATMRAIGAPLWPAEPSGTDWTLLFVSGLLGLGVCDTLFLMSLNRIGAGRSAIVDCFYSPCVILCAVVYLGESVGWPVVVAAALIGAAVLVGTLEPKKEETSEKRARLAVGVALGLLAMLTMAVGIVIAKPVLARVDPWWAITVRLAGGVIVPALTLATARGRAEVAKAFVPSASWRTIVPASFVGPYLSMIFWILGMKFAQAKIAALLNQTSTVFTLLLAALLLREPLTRRKVVAVALGIAGVAVIVLERG